MKRMMVLLVMALVMFTGNAFAVTTSFDVTALVEGSCVFTTVNNLDLGTLVPLSGTPVDQPGSITVTCSNGTNYDITATHGANLVGDVNFDLIPYGFEFTATASDTVNFDGTGIAQVIAYDVTIGANAYDFASADVYRDTVNLEILP